MKGLGEQEGGKPEPRELPQALKAQQEVEAAVGREAGESGLRNVGGGGQPHAWVPFTRPQAAQGGLGERGQGLGPGEAPPLGKASRVLRDY